MIGFDFAVSKLSNYLLRKTRQISQYFGGIPCTNVVEVSSA